MEKMLADGPSTSTRQSQSRSAAICEAAAAIDFRGRGDRDAQDFPEWTACFGMQTWVKHEGIQSMLREPAAIRLYVYSGLFLFWMTLLVLALFLVPSGAR